ncbi:hypothetical protein QR98_0038040 [Sarcoptes scabiei]|uniref:Uncharacterized protein n=1 Tax=Sarcoptes scabiei TaxID=52283 RepID=A0A132A317_SARSC|nr:hypothetical protein QR98_0038040 [Sarcoptes scabiei]
MLRSQVPSIKAKRKNSIENDENDVRLDKTRDEDDKLLSGTKRLRSERLRVALTPIRNFAFLPNLKTIADIVQEKDSHDDLIKKILNRPFKIPINNYTENYSK